MQQPVGVLYRPTPFPVGVTRWVANPVLRSESYELSACQKRRDAMKLWQYSMARRDTFHECGSNSNVVYDASLIHPTR